MDHESLMVQLARGMRDVHGDLQEVILLRTAKYISLLCFGDGTVLPTHYLDRGDRYWQVVAYSFNQYPYIETVADQISNQDPLTFLTWGYEGTGSRCYAAFVGYFGFARHDFHNLTDPCRLKKDGILIEGSREGETIVWDDDSSTPEVRIRKKPGLMFWKRQYEPD